MKINDSVYALDSTKAAYAYIILGKEIILINTGFSWVGKRILSCVNRAKKTENINTYNKDIRIGDLRPYPNMNWDEAKLIESIKSISHLPLQRIYQSLQPLKKYFNLHSKTLYKLIF